ncbi:MAG: hypothetical protein J7K77_01340 [Dehalococcoidales bacterium]|nr:hypothetical protein [Dehalococcoidales bacterium]
MEKTWKPTTAGVLNIISGAGGIGGGIFTIVAGRYISALASSVGGLGNLINNWIGDVAPGVISLSPDATAALNTSPSVLLIIGIVVLVLGALALAGGISAIRRERWGLALAGSILALFVGGVMGILSIIFVSLGRKEFNLS